MLIIIFFLIIFNLSFGLESSKIKIHFIDVGEGEAALIESKNKFILIDTGNFVSGIDLLNYLSSNGVKQIDSLIITHPHLDHIGGVFTILKTFFVLNLYDNGERLYNVLENDIYRWYDDIFRKDSRYKVLKAGNFLKYENLIIEVLWPQKDLNDWNANSLVLRLKFGNFSCLFMGDANVLTERELLRLDEELSSKVLKAGHHGAEDTGDLDFIRKVSPDVVIISINKNNIRGYPSDKTIDKYRLSGAKVYNTAENGTILIIADNEGKYEVKVER